MILLSATQASAMLAQFVHGTAARVSLDLGRTETAVELQAGRALLPGGEELPVEELRRIVKRPDDIFEVRGGAAVKLIRYSEATRLTYKLRPTADWPALEISGILMHRIKGTTPREDARAKLRLVAPVLGAVLETCMGLGYTALLAAETAVAVTAVEKDGNVVVMARLNPWSQPLFENPRIKLVAGDAAEVVPTLGEARFDIVDHDPPTLSVAGELYSNVFYAALLRSLKPGGRLLHYTGAPGSRVRGVDLGASVARRLKAVGFAAVCADAGTSCLVATRPGGGG